MDLLILGGTSFAGRAVATAALTRGHHVTLLNRGTHQPPPGVTTITGDRTHPDGLDGLGTTTYDAVIDTWSQAPHAVHTAARTLSGRAGHYTYVSSRSVYRTPGPVPLTETAPLLDGDPDAGDDTPYGEAKRGGELAAQRFDGPVLLARAGLILGPHENIGRLPWWLTRLARGGPTLAPGPRDLPLQLIDVRDLADFLLDAALSRLDGAYNVVSPPGHTTMGALLDTANEVTGSHAELHWTDPAPILAAGIEPWTHLPIWMPPTMPDDYHHIHHGDVSKALQAGLRIRPVAETIADTWAWLQELPGPPPNTRDLGLDPSREAEFLG